MHTYKVPIMSNKRHLILIVVWIVLSPFLCTSSIIVSLAVVRSRISARIRELRIHSTQVLDVGRRLLNRVVQIFWIHVLCVDTLYVRPEQKER